MSQEAGSVSGAGDERGSAHPAVGGLAVGGLAVGEQGAGVRVPVPFIHALFLGLGMLLRSWEPLAIAPPGALAWLGMCLVTPAAILSVAAVREFARARTSLLPFREVRALITRGPYRLSRNPIYLSLALSHLGAGVWIGSGWVVASALPCVLIVDGWVVRREEAYLRRRFGDAYQRYAGRVRRWI